ncbi:hypothetical protein ES319_D01G157200v1 [Gossypium barbadense]|uniref:ATPase AAA-type core domain-containing protein n=2 Tax=Gossypium TaxID=3633 RepID=A0A5J5SSX3_GOSBA|nr:hypothetical protein ES319_D01G157200v1 [Gossypium barbadense]TYG83466.1 hypothetical protein ES288_D01G170100v1 [Gossypium darwinii]
MLESFFFTKQGDFHPQEAYPITLLSGPPSSGKTSLLFQFAVNSASQCSNVNSKVLFICSRRRLETKPPYLAQGIDPGCEIFKRIKMKYINDDDDEGIKNYFAAFHLKDTFPIAVVVDDFGDFFHERSCQERYGNPRGRDLAMVRTLALCHNAIIFANKTGPCRLLLSDTHNGDSPRSLFIYKRWIRTIFTVKGDDSGSLCLKYNKYSESGSSKGTKTAKYSIAFQYLLLEGITEVDDEQ